MKKLLILAFSAFLSAPAFSQTKAELTTTLHKYYSLKDALVTDNAKEAAKQAEALNAYLLSNTFSGSKDLAGLVQKIKAAKDISKQREAFSLLSTQLILMLEASNIGETGYVQYCPMKKAEWISSQKEIKNPYYGKAMLTCGKVTDTIK